MNMQRQKNFSHFVWTKNFLKSEINFSKIFFVQTKKCVFFLHALELFFMRKQERMAGASMGTFTL